MSGDGWADSVEVTGCETILGRRVLLVDEVAPVGESLEWAARALRDAGAAQVLIT